MSYSSTAGSSTDPVGRASTAANRRRLHRHASCRTRRSLWRATSRRPVHPRRLDGPTVLVGHSYGGAVISEAGTHDNVAALVYIAAFAPDKGESVNTLIADPPPGAPVPPILPPADGFLFLDRDQVRTPRSPRTCPPTTRRSWRTRRCRGASTRWAASSASRRGAASPSWYLVATDDHMIPPAAQRAMATRANAVTDDGDRQPRRVRLAARRSRRRHPPGRSVGQPLTFPTPIDADRGTR